MGRLIGWVSARSVKLLAVTAIVVVAGFIGYYLWDNYFRPVPTILDQAEAHLEELIQANPGDPDLRVAVADVYLANGRYQEAITQYEEALKVVEDHKAALFGLGSTYMVLGNDSIAIDYFNQVIAMSKDAELARLDEQLETSYYYLGKIYLDNGELDQAIEQLESAIALVPMDADAIYLLGMAYQEQGSYLAAIENYERAVAFVPDFRDAFRGMADCYEALGDEASVAYPEGMLVLLEDHYPEAIELLEAAVTARPDIANAFWGLGAAYELTGRTDEALAAYQQALEVNPNHVLANDGLARLEGASP
jgi:tetratricopeptide (TPR) repeat protein